MAHNRKLTLPYIYDIMITSDESTKIVYYMSNVIHAKMGEGWRIAIPAELCRRYGIEPGAPLVLEPSDAGIVVRPLNDVIREVQAFFADAAPPDVVLSDGLSRDRRVEAKREACG